MPTENATHIIAMDVGTSHVKAACYDDEGRLLARTQVPISYTLSAPGHAEQAPEDWWTAICQCSHSLLQDLTPESIAALVFGSQMAGMVALGTNDKPLAPAMIAMDSRSSREARQMMRGFPKIRGYGIPRLLQWLWITNGAPTLTGKDPASKYLWWRQHGDWAKTHKLLDVKDYLLLRCTGEYVTTPDCAHLTWMMDSRKGRWNWSPTLLQKLGIERSYLPEIRPSTDIIGPLRDAAAKDLGLPTGLAIIAGAGDVSAAALGSGATKTGIAHLYIGSSSWAACHLPHRKVDILRGIGTLASAHKDDYLLIAVQESAGACVNWALTVLGLSSPSELDRLAEQAPPGSHGLMFLPWLAGERCPVDDPDVRGGFANLSLHHTRADMARAVLEGVAMNLRWALEGLAKNGAQLHQSLRFVGGGAKSSLWAQIIADVTAQTLSVPEAPDLAGTAGVNHCARIALGWSAPTINSTNLSVSPSSSRHVYDESFHRFTAYYQHTKRWYQRLQHQ